MSLTYDRLGLSRVDSGAERHEIERDAQGEWTRYHYTFEPEQAWTATVVERTPATLIIEYAGTSPPLFVDESQLSPSFRLETLGDLTDATRAGLHWSLVDFTLEDDLTPLAFRREIERDAEGRVVVERYVNDEITYVLTTEHTPGETRTTLTTPGEEAPLRVHRLLGDPQAPDAEIITGPDGVVENRWVRGPGFEELHRSVVDDAASSVTRLEFTPAGQRIFKFEDYDGDGVYDWRKRYAYAAGHRRWEARDEDMNGLIDERWDYTRSPTGRLARESRSDPRVGECGVNWDD